MHDNTLRYTLLHFNTLHYAKLNTFHYTSLHYVALHYTALNYIAITKIHKCGQYLNYYLHYTIAKCATMHYTPNSTFWDL